MRKIEAFDAFQHIIDSFERYCMVWPWPPTIGRYLGIGGVKAKRQQYWDKLESLYRLHSWKKYTVQSHQSIFVGLDFYPPQVPTSDLSQYIHPPIDSLLHLGIIESLKQVDGVIARKRAPTSRNPSLEVTIVLF